MIYNNIPLMLDLDSGYTSDQVKQINIIVKNTRNKFLAIAKQKQKEKPKAEKFIITKYSRVLNLKDYIVDKLFNIHFILDPAGFEDNLSYKLFEFDNDVKHFHFEGSNSDKTNVIALSTLGTILIETSGLKPTFIFKRNDSPWPTDANNNKVKYSVFIAGKIK